MSTIINGYETMGKSECEDTSQRGWEIEHVEAWPEAVDGKVLLDELAQVMTRHVVLPPFAAETAALWNNTTVVIDTRAVDGHDTIALNSATVGNNTNLTIATGVGTDTVAVGAGGILLAGQLSVASQTITVSGPIGVWIESPSRTAR